MNKRSQSGQNTVEYMMLAAVSAIVVLAAVGPNGFLTKAVNKSLDMGVNAVDVMARCICMPDDPKYTQCVANMPPNCPGPKGPPGGIGPGPGPGTGPGPGPGSGPGPGPGGCTPVNYRFEEYRGPTSCVGACGSSGGAETRTVVTTCIQGQCGGTLCPTTPAPYDEIIGSCTTAPCPVCTNCTPLQACYNSLCHCVGDCNLNGIYDTTDLTILVQMIYGQLPLSACPTIDMNQNGTVEGNEVTTLINVINNGCDGNGPVCGNGIYQPGEECDDGNITSGDGCSSNCKNEFYCGNGVVDSASGEECDDGNLTSGDGCSSSCKIELCAGDCNANAVVGIDDLLKVLDIALHGYPTSLCKSADLDNNNTVSITEMITMVNASQSGKCAIPKTACAWPQSNVGDCNCNGTVEMGEAMQIYNYKKTGFNPNTINPGTGRAYCGAIDSNSNNLVDDNEQDIVFQNAVNGCPTHLPVCGDGNKEPCEECDDGNTNNQDGCSSACKIEPCGGACTATQVCLSGTCVCAGDCNNDGDFTQAELDTIIALNYSACAAADISGNGAIEVNEAIFVIANSLYYGCPGVGPVCGNGFRQNGEECDDGNPANFDNCLTTCKLAKCGDGKLYLGVEQCDDGNTNPNDSCDNNCKTVACGNGIKQGAEECDDANPSNNDGCLTTCLLAKCGDGKLWLGVEQCDDGNTNNNDSCDNTCKNAVCGNGIVQTGEQCDDGNTSNTDACVSCKNAFCGDSFIRTGVEQCDDGNGVNTDACVGCKTAKCGDGFVRSGVEQCDDGNTSNTDLCTNACKWGTCGDTFVKSPGEECDDGNPSQNDGCTTCKLDCPSFVLNQCGGASVTVPQRIQGSVVQKNCGPGCGVSNDIVSTCGPGGEWIIDSSQCPDASGDCPDTYFPVNPICGIDKGYIRVGNRYRNGASFSRYCGPRCQPGDALGERRIEGYCYNGSFIITRNDCN